MPKSRRVIRGRVSTATTLSQADHRKKQIAQAFRDLDQVVYFVRYGRYIKIGTTKDLHKRKRQLGGVKNLTDILAIIPGGREVEREIHQRFASSLADKREYFYPTPALIEYINQLRDKAGVPVL